jgi:3'(2'), 5'-bisphosphate nucleotidase
MGRRVLSEETPDTRDRLASRRVWIVDPLDGTSEYSEGRDDWGVNIALAIDGVPIAGAVAVPALGDTLTTEHPFDVPPREQWPVGEWGVEGTTYRLPPRTTG